ncbi:uncharacterized protein C17orf113-like [Narcine bancroftii]|uniref:uncharacterized protein C17orf113-like n=1 Tax=Narcine bancroftii TaxID=1343680 RepID=UPI00383157B4
MPALNPMEQQTVATQHKHKRIKQEAVSLQPGHSCQSYTAPLDLRSQQEMPGTSYETTATGSQSKVERVKTEEDTHNYTYQFYKDHRAQQFISDSSDTSSDEASMMQPPIHHPATYIKQEESSQQPFYGGQEKLPDQRHKPWLPDNPSDEIVKGKTPIYRTTAARNRQDRILQEEESPSEGHRCQSALYRGKQTLTQVLQQLGAQRPLRSLYNEFSGPFELPEELPHNQYRVQKREDSTFKRRNQLCKGENSYKMGPSSAPKLPAGCMKKSEQAATCLLRNVYFAAKEMIPNSSTEALIELCSIQGLGDLADQLGAHLRHKSVEDFQQAIAEVMEEEILKRARSCNCFSILIDQSEDCFTKPCLFLYLRIIEHIAGGYEPKTYFLAVKEMQEGVSAEKITAGLTEVLKEKGLDLKLMCGLAIDGATVGAECRSSVVAELKTRAPGLLSIRCIAHRLALSCGSAADTVPYLVKYQQILDSVYTHFAELPKGRDGLEAMQKVLGDWDKQSGAFRDIFPSRWLTVRASVEAVIRSFGRLIPALRDSCSARAAGLAKTMCTYKFLYCSHFLADVLHQLSILGKSYQSPEVDFSIMHSLLKSTVTTINKLGADSAGEMLKNLLATLPAGACSPDGSFTFQSQLIKGGPCQCTEAESTCAIFLENLSRDLRARFSEAGDADTMTAMTAIFDPTHASDSKSRHVQTLTNYLSSLGGQGDEDHFEMSCKQELISFMNFVESRPGIHTLTSAKDVCQLALKQKFMFPVVGSLAERFLTLPIPTAELQGLFHRQHLLRSRLGNSLTSKSLENLLKIAVHGPPIKEFNFAAAFQQLGALQS